MAIVASVKDSAQFRRDTPADDVPGVNNAVVSHGFWKNRLGADRSIVGRTVGLSDRPFTVIGVADRVHSAPMGQAPVFWTTLATLLKMG
jgi:hypothetical protein